MTSTRMPSTTRAPRARRFGARATAVTGLTVVGIAALSGIALACHAIPNAAVANSYVTCGGTVHFQVDSWSQDTHDRNAYDDAVLVEVAVNGGDFHRATTASIGPGAPITGDYASGVAVVTSATVRATPQVAWRGGDPTLEARTASVSAAPGTCSPTPGAQIGEVSCDSGAAAIALTNTGTRSASFTVTGTAPASSQDAAVPAGGSASLSVPVTEGATSTVTVTSGGQTVTSRDLTRSCMVSRPRATVSGACAGLTAHLDNSASNVAVVFTVRGPDGSTSSTHEVQAGASQDVTLPVTEDTTGHLTVSAGEEQLAAGDYTRDCQHAAPAATVTADCSAQHLLLTDSGDQDAVFALTEDGTSTRVTVPAGSSLRRDHPLRTDGTHTVTVSSPGMDDVSSTYVRSCTPALPPTPQSPANQQSPAPVPSSTPAAPAEVPAAPAAVSTPTATTASSAPSVLAVSLSRPVVHRAAQPATKPIARPAVKPVSKPASQPVSQPVTVQAVVERRAATAVAPVALAAAPERTLAFTGAGDTTLLLSLGVGLLALGGLAAVVGRRTARD